MDLRERHGEGAGVENRHPWEISRTGKVLKVFAKYLDQGYGKTGRRYVNVGAGDLYFDNFLLEKYAEDKACAVDLEYDESVPDYPRIEKLHYLEEVPDEMDYGIMMDSLEYMPDDREYVQRLCNKIKDGGYLFFTLPAVPAVFSEYDHIVKNLRRYDIAGFKSLTAWIPEMDIVECHYFYTCLFMIRYIQVCLKLKIDRKKNVTSHWKYSEKNWITRCIVWILNIDFEINRLLSKINVRMPGLSLLVICRKRAGIQKRTGNGREESGE